MEKEIAIHSSILAWEILWTEGPGGLRPWGARSRIGPKRLKHTQTYKIKPRLEIYVLPSFSF